MDYADATEKVVFEFCRLNGKQWLEVVLGDAPVSAYLEEVVSVQVQVERKCFEIVQGEVILKLL